MKNDKRRRLKIDKPLSGPAHTGEFLAGWLNSDGWGYPVEAQQRLKALLLELNGVRLRAAKRLEIGEAELGPINELLKEYPWVLVLRSPKTPPGKAPSSRLYFATEPAGPIEQGHTWLNMLVRLMSLGLLDRMRSCAYPACRRWFYARLPKAQFHSTPCRQAHFRSMQSKEERAEYQKNYFRDQLSVNKEHYRKGLTPKAVRELKRKRKERQLGKKR